MTSNLIYKMTLQYFLDDKKVIFYNEICSNGLSTNTISIENTKITKKTINNRVLSEECYINNENHGYTYIYDNEGTTVDLKPINENISVDESLCIIKKIKNTEEFIKVQRDGLLLITNSAELISVPSQKFTIFKEISSYDTANTLAYSLQQNYTCNDKTSEMVSEKEKYQINDNQITITSDSKDTVTEEITSPFIKQLESLKELLKSSPKNYKNLKIESQLSNTKKTIR